MILMVTFCIESPFLFNFHVYVYQHGFFVSATPGINLYHRAKMLATPKLTPVLAGLTTALLLTRSFFPTFTFSLIQKVFSSSGKQKSIVSSSTPFLLCGHCGQNGDFLLGFDPGRI